MQEAEIPQIAGRSLNIAQRTIKPLGPNQTQSLASAPTSSQPTKVKLLKKILIISAALLVIAGLVVFGFYWNNLQNIKERDAKRKSDLVIIQQALEKYKQDTLNAQYYPTALTPTTLLKPGYVSKIPTDPNNISPFLYTYQGTPTGCVINCTGYTLTACLENKNDKEENTTDPIAPCTTRSYQVSKP